MLKGLDISLHRCLVIFISAALTEDWKFKQSKCPSVNELIVKMRSIHIVYHSAIRRNEVVSFVTTHLVLGIIM